MADAEFRVTGISASLVVDRIAGESEARATGIVVDAVLDRITTVGLRLTQVDINAVIDRVAEGSPGPVSAAMSYPAEWTTTTTRLAQLSAEINATAGNQIEPPVFWAGVKEVSAWLAMTAQWAGALAREVSIPASWTEHVRADSTLLVLTGQPGFGAIGSIPVAYSGNVSSARAIPGSWSGVTQSNETVQIETLALLSVGGGISMAWGGSGAVQAFIRIPVAVPAELLATGQAAASWGSLFSESSKVPASWSVVVDAIKRIAQSWGGTVGGKLGERIPIYSRTEVDGTGRGPLVFDGNVSQDASERIPIDKLGVIAANGELPLVWAGHADATWRLSASWAAASQEIAKLPADFGQNVVSGDKLAVAKLQKILSAAELPSELIQDGMLLFIAGNDSAWVTNARAPSSDTWGQDGGDSAWVITARPPSSDTWGQDGGDSAWVITARPPSSDTWGQDGGE